MKAGANFALRLRFGILLGRWSLVNNGMAVQIELKTPFDLRMTCRSHGWVNLAPFEWLEDSGALQWTVSLGEEISTLMISQLGPKLLEASIPVSARAAEAEQCVRRVLMLDWDASEAARVARACDRRVASLVEAGAGRLLRGSSAFEDVVKTICTINTSWQNTQAMVDRLVSLSGSGVFPKPSEILQFQESELKRMAPVGYRASTIIAIAELAERRDLGAIELGRLAEIRGLGPYALAHIAVLRGDYSVIPFDSEVRSYCARHLGIRQPDANTVHEHFGAWGRYRFLGYKLGRIARSENWIGD